MAVGKLFFTSLSLSFHICKNKITVLPREVDRLCGVLSLYHWEGGWDSSYQWRESLLKKKITKLQIQIACRTLEGTM